MTDAFIETFLASFDDSQYPEPFLEKYEMLECLANKDGRETFLIKDRHSGDFFVAKCNLKNQSDSHTSESDLLRKVSHAGLPVFIGEYENDSTLIVVRSFIPGIPLDEFVTYFEPNKELFLSIATQICEILSYLHRQTPAIIHRDIKPQNIIIDRKGKVTLIDFGISRVYDETSQADTTCLGTRYFAAPEQYGFSQTDCRTDIFSLGVVLAWLRTGEWELEQAKKKLSHDRLGKTILKCTAFDPKDRYQNASQVIGALSSREFRHKAAFFSLAFITFIISAIFFLKHPVFNSIKSRGVIFQDQSIEEAVRLTLEKGPDEAITEDELLGIETLRIYGNRVALNEVDIQTYTSLFVQNDPLLSRGTIERLDDLLYLKNLRNLTLIYQNISDIRPLAQLSFLEYVDFRHNPIEDISPLSAASGLSTLNLFGTDVKDLTALDECELLSTLDVGNTQIDSFSALDGLDSLVLLNIRRNAIQSLEGITNHPMLKEIYLSETNVNDFSLLLELPNLQYVHVGEEDRIAIEKVESPSSFVVIYD